MQNIIILLLSAVLCASASSITLTLNPASNDLWVGIGVSGSRYETVSLEVQTSGSDVWLPATYQSYGEWTVSPYVEFNLPISVRLTANDPNEQGSSILTFPGVISSFNQGAADTGLEYYTYYTDPTPSTSPSYTAAPTPSSTSSSPSSSSECNREVTISSTSQFSFNQDPASQAAFYNFYSISAVNTGSEEVRDFVIEVQVNAAASLQAIYGLEQFDYQSGDAYMKFRITGPILSGGSSNIVAAFVVEGSSTSSTSASVDAVYSCN